MNPIVIKRFCFRCRHIRAELLEQAVEDIHPLLRWIVYLVHGIVRPLISWCHHCEEIIMAQKIEAMKMKHRKG